VPKPSKVRTSEATGSLDDVAGLDRVVDVADRLAAAGAEAGRLDPAVVDALVEARLFKLFLPEELGGLSLSLPDACRVIARVAEADAAAGWAVMIGAGPNWFAGHMPEPLAAAVFGPAESVVAGSGVPGSARATDDGGWTVSGRWRYCSGSPWATWFTFGAMAEQTADAEPVDDFVVAVPGVEVLLHPDTWDTQGLRATASWDAELVDAQVTAERAFRIYPDRPVRSEPIFRVPFLAFAQATMAAVSVGAAQRALGEFVALAQHKRPYGSTVLLADDALAADRLARATARCWAAARLLEAATEAVWGACAAGDRPSAAQLLELQLAACEAAACGARSAGALWEIAGMSVLPRGSALGRAIVDLHAASQNAVVSAPRFVDAGRALLLQPGTGT
jgi:alkylation response protein AidB-like acyl-CoA dehydrogenase